jgi:NAD(P)-dependent dehydrogenase (short-subunit alcohol dehydrogenase family)
MAIGFAEAGADVIVTSRKLDACQAVVDEIVASTGRRAVARACHVGKWQDVDALVEFAYDELGRVDILVNNAGMSPVYSSPEEVTEDLYDKVLAVNLKGPFRLAALIGARMCAGDGGSIINVSSHSAENPEKSTIFYSAAKAGLNAMTIGFADAFGPKVRVNTIQPGAFMTDISKAWDPEWFAVESQRYALRRGGEPSEIVGTALYLASAAASSYTTGATIRVDGGNF